MSEQIHQLVIEINEWDHEDINDLYALILRLGRLIKYDEINKVADWLDLSSLNSEPIEPAISDYPVWAKDKKGFCLVGAGDFEIMHIDEIKK